MSPINRLILISRLLVLAVAFGGLGPGLESAHGAPASGEHPWLDRSHSIFLTPELGEKLGAQQRFPAFWWNFLVLEGGESGLVASRNLCSRLKNASQWVAKSGCEDDLSQFQSIVKDWARDLPLREAMPEDRALGEAMDQTLSKASLPLEHSMLDILRVDPFGTFRELQAHAEARLKLNLERVSGFYHDAASRRWVVPVQFGFPPSDTRKTRSFLTFLGGEPRWELVGAHGATLSNESQVTGDLGVVSFVGTALTLILGTLAVFFGRWRLILMLPPVLVATAFGALATIWICGSIHGLTLSLGTGIIGMAVDYGLFSALNGGSLRSWKANLFGVLTTLAGLLILMKSSIPLLRQMMIFSSIGLGFAFAAFFFLHRVFPRVFDVRPVRNRVSHSRWKLTAALVMALASVVGAVILRPSLDMEQMNFQTPRAAETARWLFPKLSSKPPLIEVTGEFTGKFTGGFNDTSDPLAQTTERRVWAEKSGIALENPALYLPPLDQQLRNLESWKPRICGGWADRLKPETHKFFEPFLNHLSCASLIPAALSSVPSYLRDLEADGRWMTLWLPDSDEQSARIKARYPNALSLKEAVSLFPVTLARELRWMAPASFLLATALLFVYYGAVIPVLVALFPFFSGVGLVAAAELAFGLPFTFVSLVGLVMVFGFSFDYGIFATEIRPGSNPEKIDGVWTSLTFAALVTGSGFFPLLFCHHPVLRQLGVTLFFGAVGTYLGAVWGVPSLMEWYVNRSRQNG